MATELNPNHSELAAAPHETIDSFRQTRALPDSDFDVSRLHAALTPGSDSE